jgi:flagellar motor switch protein FliN/FliY
MSNLTQEEIDALLSGTASPQSAESRVDADIPVSSESAAGDGETEGRRSPEPGGPEAPHTVRSDSLPELEKELEKELERQDISKEYLTPEEKDILGEMGNICMGASATTMYTLLGRRVNITTPQVHVYTSEEVLSIYRTPFVVVTVEYSKGMEGKNLLILKERDSVLITDLLMGGDGNNDMENVELDEIHLSAMSEIMNQMIGASATSLSNLLGRAIDITPPQATCVGMDTDVSRFLDSHLVIKVSFDMEIEGLLKSKLMQLMTVETGKKLARALLSGTEPEHDGAASGRQARPSQEKHRESPAGQAAGPAGAQAASGRKKAEPEEEARPVRVKPLTYESFDKEEKAGPRPTDNPVIDLISDIPLQVAVELGKTKKSIHDILNMGIGSVIVLDKLAGELVEVVGNGKHIARGEVVVIDENYGVRITDIDHAF